MHQMLIVDDQIYLADDLSRLMPWSELGISTVHTAYSAYEALELFQSHPIDIVITDIRMPGMSGLELIEEIGRANKTARCILVSGYSDFEYAKKAIQSKISDYLLKPVADEEVRSAVQKAVSELDAEWNELNSRQRLEQAMRENLPMLKETFLMDLVSGKRMSEERLAQRVQQLGLPLQVRQPVCLLLIRMEDYFDRYDPESTSLFEYAIFNMAHEIFSNSAYGFSLLHGKDIHEYLVVLLSFSPEPKEGSGGVSSTVLDHAEALVKQLAGQLQHYVNLYLKGTVSLILTPFAEGLQEVSGMYYKALAAFRQQIGGEQAFLLSSPVSRGPGKAQSVNRLYEPPTLLHLLEGGQWDNVRRKLDSIFQELDESWSDSHEHILETYFAIASAFIYIVHKSSRWMSQVLPQDHEKLISPPQFNTLHQLKEWAYRMLDRFINSLNEEMRVSRSATVVMVHDYIAKHLGEATLQSIASHVYLNSSYLSKIYKLETGEGISEYMYRMRMEKAARLLTETGDKIYEIAQRLGYLKTSYFIKLFKEKYGLTPQEYRDQLRGR